MRFLERNKNLVGQGDTTDESDKMFQECKSRQYIINEQTKSYLKADETYKMIVHTVLLVASKAYDFFESSKIERKRKLINYAFSNLEPEGTTLRYSFKNPLI